MFQTNQTQGGGLFGGAGTQNQPTGGFGFGNQGQPAQGNQFGGTGGSLFGGNTQAPSTGLFGGQQQQNQQPVSAFGQPNPQTNAFGGNKPAALFGGANQPTQSTGLFGQQAQQPQQGGSLFGGGQQPQQGGMFGGGQQQTQAGGGLFGNTQQNQGGLFGGQSTTPAFGIGNQPQQGALFGGGQTPSFAPTTNQGIFGGQQQTTGAGLFGGQAKTGGLLGATQQPQQIGFGTFGQPNTTTPGLFGGQTQQTQPQSTGLWGGQPAQQPQQQGWGQTGTNFGANTTNQLGGTSWGVNTAIGQPNMNQMSSHPPVIPVKPKNTKLDGKHTIKCIAAMDQFLGMSK